MMKNFKNSLIGLFLAISPLLTAQQAVSGRITDAEDGMPVVGASVFISNTTVGISTDLDGNYSFTVPGRGSFEIVVSHVGYQSVFHKIEEPKDAHRYDVALAIAELEEVTVSAARTYKNSDVNLFWQKILGENPSKRGLEVLNPEKVYFYKSAHILKAFCREPIEIVNHQTGYRIRYILQSFEHNYQTGGTEFKGMPSFEELTPRTDREEKQWAAKRREVYTGSINRFLRALYHEQVNEEGFLVVHKELLMYGITSYVPETEILRNERGEKTLNITEPLYLLNFPTPLTGQALQEISLPDLLQIERPKTEATNAKMDELLQYKNSWIPPNRDRVLKEQETQSTDYSRWLRKNMPVVVELMPSQITVYPDGTYSGILTLGEVNKYIGGMSARVPVEYPEVLQGILYDNPVLPFSHLTKAEENISAQLESFPQEKIHLHTDRSVYFPGEKIWFKAYVADARSHLNTTNSYYVYVELISPADTLVNRVMVAQIDGMFFGHLPVPGNIPEGDYTLRTYTRYMENLGDDYFFKKNIRIAGNREGRRNNVAGRNDFDISFFPEGGNLPEGVFSKVAFKALNRNGYPETVSGTLIDDTGAEITPVLTGYAGMGIITYLPEAGKKYRLKCKNASGLEKLFDLPQSSPNTYSLATSMQHDKIMVGVQKSVNAPDIPGNLLIHSRGTVLYFSEWDGRQAVSLMKEDLPAGVIQIVLFDRQMNPLSERLVFSKNEATIPIGFQTDKETYQIRDKVFSTLSLSPSLLGRAGEGSFSIAVTDDKDVAVDESTTIQSSLLLSSELKGYIENPAYYFQDDVAMDLLMMTHGWRRYSMPDVVQGHLEHPKTPFQLYQGISGRVETIALSRPVRDSEIMIMMQNREGRGFRTTTTDSGGKFSVLDLDFADSTEVFIQASSRNGRSELKLTVDNESYPKPVYAPQNPLSIQKSIDTETKDELTDNAAFIAKAGQRTKFDEDIWTQYLDEVVVTAQRVVKKDESRLQYWANASSDRTLSKETLETYKFESVVDYLSMLPGVSVMRDANKGYDIYFSNTVPDILTGKRPPALLLIDGVEDSGSEDKDEGESHPVLNSLRGDEIESIDVFSGVGATAFGVRGAGGAISITTKSRSGLNAQPQKPNNLVYMPLGYQNPVEFYAPRYETYAARQSPVPDYRTTIFWKPDIVLSGDGETTIVFYTSDFPTTYSVVIEGLTSDGKIVRQVERITVSD